MPDNNTNGMLEDFISFLIPKKDRLLEVAQSTLKDIEVKDYKKVPDNRPGHLFNIHQLAH